MNGHEHSSAVHLTELRRLAEATGDHFWIKRPFGKMERRFNRPATREIERLREGVLALLDDLEAHRAREASALGGRGDTT